ncbi:MAG: ferredoxin--NADP reductase [Acidobacteria bacterium]|nr:ferredoxin--NADP reductase [Acidobacteriota bacterium]
MPPGLNAKVLQRVDVTPELMILQVVPDGWELPEFSPGQFGVLGLPGSHPRHELCDSEDPPAKPEKLIRRAYSVSSSSKERQFLEFYISLVRSGALTPRLWTLKTGNRLWLGPKFSGMFTIDQIPEELNIVLVATGTGLAPYMSMVRTELMLHRERRIGVIHGARHSWDLGYRSELSMLHRLLPNFTYVPIISMPDEEPVRWGGLTGFINGLWEEGVIAEALGFTPTPDETHILLCGNPLMIEGMIHVLGKDNFVEQTKATPGQIHLERYW